jgi:hypothetical protein
MEKTLSKKDTYYKDAEKLFIQDQCTVNEIAEKLNLGEKTVRNWKGEGNWEEGRKQFFKEMQAKQSFHEELYDFSRSLMRTIQEDWDAGEKVDSGRLYTLTRLLPLITKVKDYEDKKVEYIEPEGQDLSKLSFEELEQLEKITRKLENKETEE